MVACKTAPPQTGQDSEHLPESTPPVVAPDLRPTAAGPSQVRFLIAAGDTAVAAGRLEKAKRHYEDALSLARDTSADAEEILARNQLGVLAERLGALEDARDHYRRALELQQVAPGAVPEARLRANLAGTLARLGDSTAAEREFTLALAAVELDRDPASAGAVYRQLGRARGASGQHAEEKSALASAVTLFERAGFALEAARTRLELGIALLAADDPRDAIRELSRALQGLETAMARGSDERRARVDALTALATCYEQLQQPKYGLTFHERAVEQARGLDDRAARTAVLTRAAAAARAADRIELALQFEAERTQLAAENGAADGSRY